MAEQGTEQKTDSSDDQDTGRHAASEESSSDEPKTESMQQADSGQQTESEKDSEQKSDSEQDSDSGRKTDSDQKTERSGQGQQSRQADSGSGEAKGSDSQRGHADTSWAEPEHDESGSSHRRSLDVGELAWRTGNVLATVVRTLALLFALVLVVNVVLVFVGVNPANGVAQFVGAVASAVLLGFRDLFIPANPLLMLVVNSLVAAIFWVFVGELLSRLIRFLAARVK